jgi:Zn-dependent protease with chaperone function
MTSTFSPLLVALALGLVLALVAALAVRVLEPLVARGSSAIWAALALAPLWLGALFVASLLSPGLVASACHCAPHGDHHPHLCWTHAGSAAPFVLPALAFAGAWVLVVAPAVGRTVFSLVRSTQLARAVRGTAASKIDGIGVHVLDCGEPTAFTAGVLSPRIVVDRSLLGALDERALSAVVHHEQAHVLRRDGLTLAALRLAAACVPGGLLRSAVERWVAGSEAECDGHAARSIDSAVDVASALVRVEKLRAARASVGQRELAPAIASADLDRRVRALLAAHARPPSLAIDVISVAIAVTGLFVLALLWPGDAVHHLTETVLGHALSH